MRHFIPGFRRLLVVTLCVGIILAAGCARREPEPSIQPTDLLVDKAPDAKANPKKPLIEASKPPEMPDLSITQEGVTLSWDDKSGRTMVAKAKSDSFDLRTQIGTLLDFSAKLYENGALLASMTAPHAYVDGSKRVVVATGGVDLQFTNPPTRVRSAWIKWIPDKHRIIGNGGVKMTYPNATATAAAFIGDTRKQTLELRDSGKGLE